MIKYLSNQRHLISDHRIEFVSASDIISMIKGSPYISIDVETTGLDPHTDRMLLVSVTTDKGTAVIDVSSSDISFLAPYLEDKKIQKIGQNIGFDYKFFRKKGITIENVWDTMLAEQVLDTGLNKKHDLGTLVFNYMGIQLNKGHVKSFFNHRGAFTVSDIIYAANDTKYLNDIMAMQIEKINKENLMMVTRLENSACLALADIEYNGLALNIPKWFELADKAKEKKEELSRKMDEIIMNQSIFSSFRAYAYNLSLFEPEDSIRKVDVNWDSPKQVLKVMKKLVPTLESVGEPVLENYKKLYPLIQIYVDYKGYGKLTSSYGYDFIKHINVQSGRIHTSFKQILNTGRISSSNPNMQQIPGDNEYRNCFTPGIEDFVFVSADYVSQELTLLAYRSKDPVWNLALESGQDLHSICAELIFGQQWKDETEADCAFYHIEEYQFDLDENRKPIQVPYYSKQKCNCSGHKKLRTFAKTLDFGLAYGMGPHKLANQLDISEDQARSLMGKFFEAFPKIDQALSKAGQFGKRFGYVQTYYPWSRKRFFPGWMKYGLDPETLSKIERESKNTSIQGSGADMVKYALVLIRKEINAHKLPVQLVMTVHDQIDTICHKDYADKWKDKMKELMEEAALRTVDTGLLKADVNITDYWSK